MPVLRIRVSFLEVYVLDDADAWGTGEWFMRATVDGRNVGDPEHEYEAREHRTFQLEPRERWTCDVDVSAKGPGDTVLVTFRGTERDPVGSDEDLGEVRMLLRHPFRQEVDHWYQSSIVDGKRHYNVRIAVTIVEEHATTSLAGFDDLRVSRGHAGATTFTATTAGTAVTPRVEICPVIPVPEWRRLPPRPAFPPTVASGTDTPEAARVPPAAGRPWNALPNPAVIPIIAPTDPEFENKAARIAVTHYIPRNLDLSYLFWRVASGPVRLSGPTTGTTVVKAYGTGSGASDQEALIELRWRDASGPLLGTYRAWVGRVKRIHYRANIVSGPTNNSRVTNVTPDDVAMHIDCCKMYFWQAGIELVPDDAANGTWDGAVPVPGRPGIFTIRLTAHAGWTRRVNLNVFPLPVTRLNFRPGVLNIVYVHSTRQRCAAAVDRPGLRALSAQPWAVTRGADDVLARLAGSPSTSWVQPSGYMGDGAPGEIQMLLIFESRRGTNASDRAYARTRTPHLTQNDWDRLYAFVIPSIWSSLPGSDPLFSYNVAHETGHVLGLRHRGNGGYPNNPPYPASYPLSDDEVNNPAVNGLVRHGHPFLENIMTYHILLSQDFDLIQAMVIRSHPLANTAP